MRRLKLHKEIQVATNIYIYIYMYIYIYIYICAQIATDWYNIPQWLYPTIRGIFNHLKVTFIPVNKTEVEACTLCHITDDCLSWLHLCYLWIKITNCGLRVAMHKCRMYYSWQKFKSHVKIWCQMSIYLCNVLFCHHHILYPDESFPLPGLIRWNIYYIVCWQLL